MPRIKDVAQKAGVSVATVSRVINHNPNVKTHLKERVLRAIEEIGYQPSGIARSMRNQSLPVVGLIISDIQNPFFTSMVRAVEDTALENGYTVLLCNSDEDPKKEQLYIDVMARERVAGIIIVPSHSECCPGLKKLNIPIVVVDRKLRDMQCDAVLLDNVSGSKQATEYLINLGHRRIGLVAAPTNISVGADRLLGYQKALREHGIPEDKSLIEIGNFKETGGYQAAMNLLELELRPTAIFSVNNLMTMGTLKAINEKGLRIPDDISVIGFDDMPWLTLITPPLTAVRQPVYKMGAEAAKLLFERMNSDIGKSPARIILKPELIIRGSTSPIEQIPANNFR